jgi:hypothetical protein
MFVNDVFGLCRSNFLTGDVFGNQFGTQFGQTTPFAFGAGNITGQAYHPVYGYLVNRIPQGYFHGVTPQTFGNTLGVNTLGVNTLGAHGLGVNQLGTLGAQSFLPFYGTPFTGQGIAQGGFNGIGYGFSPYTVSNWNWTSPLGLQTQICR